MSQASQSRQLAKQCGMHETDDDEGVCEAYAKLPNSRTLMPTSYAVSRRRLRRYSNALNPARVHDRRGGHVGADGQVFAGNGDPASRLGAALPAHLVASISAKAASTA